MDDPHQSAARAALSAAQACGGVVWGPSAALVWGWSVKTVPERPVIAVGRGSRCLSVDTSPVQLVRPRLASGHIEGLVTTRARTVVDCLRSLPFDAALAVADSALRTGSSREDLVTLMDDARGPGVVSGRQAARLADGRAANAFESVLRAICLSVPGLDVVPQVDLGSRQAFIGRPDLVDLDLRIVIEADSFEYHSRRSALRSDVRKVTAFGLAGWLVLRFSYEDVMFRPQLVRGQLMAAVRLRTEGVV